MPVRPRMVVLLLGPGYAACSFSNTGLKAALAFLSSSAGSPPEIMLVSATPKTSRNSVTETISGNPGRTMLWQAIAWVAFSLALIPAYRHFLGKNDQVTDQTLLNKKGAQLVGQRVALESAIVAGVGRVKIGDAFWQVRGPDMPAGTRIIITGVDSMILIVEADRD